MLARRITFLLTLGSIALTASGFVVSPLAPFAGSAPSKTSLPSTESETMEIEVGYKIPDVTLIEGSPDYGKPTEVNLAELIKGKKVAIFAVPGAFTPGCSKSHLPSFIDAQDELKAKGVEMTICIATNDAYVMEAWGRTSGGADAGIRFLSDANGELTKAMGLSMETPVMLRTKRFSLIADDGVVTNYFSSAEESSNTWAPNVLASL
jgi:peroxiredoxin